MKDNYTHYLECFEYCGKGKKRRYFNKCRIIGTLDDKIIICSLSSKSGKVVLRYVNQNRLIKMYETFKSK